MDRDSQYFKNLRSTGFAECLRETRNLCVRQSSDGGALAGTQLLGFGRQTISILPRHNR